LVAVDGILYDLKGLANEHPGGSIILASGAYDASALFHSMHPGRKPETSTLLKKYEVGIHRRREGDPRYTFDSAFARDLIKSVRKAMRERGTSLYAPSLFFLRILIIAAATIFCEWKWATTGAWTWGVLCGVLHAQIGLSVQHDASHGAISRTPWINAMLAYGADWIGNSRWIWFQQHILWHHPHTNHQVLDPDASSAEPFVVFSDYSKRGQHTPTPPKPSRWTAYQDRIVHLVLSFYGVSVVYNPYVLTMRHNEHVPEGIVRPGEFMDRQKTVAWSWRLFYLLRMVFAPWMSGASLLTSLLLVNTVTGILLTFVFVVSHNFEGSDRDPSRLTETTTKSNQSNAICWYRAQVETSCSYGGTIAMILTGGLNFQIEHHVFPRICSWHYPFLKSTIRDCCKRHGVRYQYYPSLIHNVRSMLRYVRRVGIVLALSGSDSSGGSK